MRLRRFIPELEEIREPIDPRQLPTRLGIRLEPMAQQAVVTVRIAPGQ